MNPRQIQPGVFLLLRRLRLPLIILILVYAVAVLGMTLMPGADDQGRAWHMSFFHAFYFISFLGTTIGLGEVPHPFSDQQRLWAMVSIYGTVTAWLYAIGRLLGTLQDPLFRRIMAEAAFANAVRGRREPFVLLCGYDDAGSLVTRELTEEGIGVVMLDRNSDRVDAIETDGLCMQVPALQANAVEPATLLRAGITHPQCTAVLALTGDDAVNLTVSLNVKLLAPEKPVVCVAHHHHHQAAMARVGIEHIINPNDTFAERLAQALLKPSMHVIYEALTTQNGTAMAEAPAFPRGKWLVCGFGRFGRTVQRHLSQVGIEVRSIDKAAADAAAQQIILGDAMDADTLRTAGIESADGVVVATSDDTTSLAIAMLARELNPAIFIVVRQCERRNTPLFRALGAQINTLSGYIVAAEVLRIIRAPQLSYFLRLARQQNEEWASSLLQRMRENIGDAITETWSLTLDPHHAPAVMRRLGDGAQVLLGDLLRAPDNRELSLKCVALLLQRAGNAGKVLLPGPQESLYPGDRLLLCGREISRGRLHWTLHDDRVLAYVLDGTESRLRRLVTSQRGAGS
jgi:voltage-gated potassium channel